MDLVTRDTRCRKAFHQWLRDGDDSVGASGSETLQSLVHAIPKTAVSEAVRGAHRRKPPRARYPTRDHIRPVSVSMHDLWLQTIDERAQAAVLPHVASRRHEHGRSR